MLKVGFLGVVQGITELLPISSTAHMRIIPALAGLAGSRLRLLGRHAARRARGRDLVFLGRRRAAWLEGTLAAVRRRDFEDWNFRFFRVDHPRQRVPIAIFGLLLKSKLNACNSPLRTLAVIGIACIVMGALLAYAEKAAAKHLRTIDQRLAYGMRWSSASPRSAR